MSDSDVSIGHTGRLEGDVKAERVLVSGYVEGCLDCASLEIVAQGRVYGELHSDDFVIEPGGQFLGQSYPRRQETIAALSHDRAAARLIDGETHTDSTLDDESPITGASATHSDSAARRTSSSGTTDLRGEGAKGGAGLSGRTTGADAASTTSSETAEEEADEEGAEGRETPQRPEPRQPIWGRR